MTDTRTDRSQAMTTKREAALPLADAPKDHTMLWLLVDYSGDGANPLEDKILGWTIGHNGFDHTGVDEWEFAGWSWEQDCFTQGVGNVVGWYPLQRPDQQPDTPATEPQRYVGGLAGQDINDAICDALGDAMDCTRVWDAWHYGTMSDEDFVLVRDDAARVEEIVAAINNALAARPAPQPAAEHETDPVWIAGNEFALGRLCAVLGVNPDQVVWDGSDGSLNEEADGLIWRIVEASGYTQPAADTPALDDELATMISDLSHTGELSMLYRMEIADRITALRAALDAAEARAVGVKPLMWVQRKDYLWAAESLCGMIYITEYAGSQTPLFLDIPGCRKDAYHPTLEAAKAAAQADYENRILSALHPASPLGAVATDSFDQLIAESKAAAIRAMIKYPQPNYVISKVAEESGEVVKAAIHCAEGRETPENVIGEMRQTIAMLYRLWVDGDQVHGLAALAPFARKGE